MKVSKDIPAKKLNILLYAVPGDGKTTLAASAIDVPELNEVLFLDIDRGLRSLQDRAGKFSHVQINSAKEFEDAIVELAGEKGKQYKTVVVDSVTELCAMELEAITKAAVAKGGRRDNVDQTELIDYKLLGSKVLRLLRLARDLPQTIIYTAKATKIVPVNADNLPIPGAVPTEIFPTMPKKVREELLGMVDAACYLAQDKEGVRKLYTTATGPVVAKNRIANLPAIIANPTMKHFTNPKQGA